MITPKYYVPKMCPFYIKTSAYKRQQMLTTALHNFLQIKDLCDKMPINKGDAEIILTESLPLRQVIYVERREKNLIIFQNSLRNKN